MEKSRVLIVGGTGYLGKRLVKASLAQGHETYVLHRPENGVDIERVQLLLSFKEQGARLVTGSFNDHQSLVNAVKLVDVVICAISGVHIRSHQILLQLKLVDAIKQAGNIKRFLPSEFGTDPARMAHALEPGRVTFDDKMVVRKAIQEAGIPFTYISANCFAGYFLGGLCQPGFIIPPMDSVVLFGDGNIKGIYVDEDDIAMYTIKTIDDPRTLNKTVYIRPPENILSQREVVQIWEKLIGKELQKSSISAEQFLSSLEGQPYAEQVGMIHYYHVCFEGCLTNFEIGEEGVEACELYPQIKIRGVTASMAPRNRKPAICSVSGDGSSSVETDVPFPTDYSELLEQARVAVELAMKDNIQLMEIEFPTAGLASVPGDGEGGTEMTGSMQLIREFCDRFITSEKATRTRIFFPEASEVDFARQSVFSGASFKLDYLTKPSFFEDFGFVEKVKMQDRVKAGDELFLVAYPYFNVNEMLVVEELYKEAVLNTERKLIIFNGELDRIRSGYYPPFFYPKLAALTKTFLPMMETVYYIHNFKGRNGGTLFRCYPGSWKVLRRVGSKYVCLHQQDIMPSLKEVALEILPTT